MCLSVVSERYDPPIAEKIVYKVFAAHSNGGLGFQYRYSAGNLRFGRWMTARKRKIGYYSDHKYESGFHAYATKKAAENHCGLSDVVIPVLFRNITSRGKQQNQVVYVARKMLILMPPPEIK
jgi:hypothetical protein